MLLRSIPRGASRSVLAMPAWSLKTRRAPPSWYCRGARVYGLTTTAMHGMSTPLPPSPLPVPPRLPSTHTTHSHGNTAHLSIVLQYRSGRRYKEHFQANINTKLTLHCRLEWCMRTTAAGDNPKKTQQGSLFGGLYVSTYCRHFFEKIHRVQRRPLLKIKFDQYRVE